MNGVNISRLCGILIFSMTLCWQSACSIPNLQSQQCAEAQDSVKQFYSWYLGTDAEMRAKQQDVFRRYISPASTLSRSSAGPDPFFNSDTPPTTFKIGRCEVVDPSHTNVQVQLFWRHQDEKIDQKEVYADTVKDGDKWLIDKIENR